MRLTRARVLWMVGAAAAVGVAAWRLRPEALEVEVATVTEGTLRVTLEEDGLTRVRHHVEIAAVRGEHQRRLVVVRRG